MPHTEVHAEEVIEHLVRIRTFDDATAAHIGEVLARVMVSLSAEDVEVSQDVLRYDRVCHHVFREDEVQP